MTPSWTDLPPEIIELICKKVACYPDQLRFRAVCKTWRVPLFSLRRYSKSHLWLIRLNDSYADIVLYDPFAQKEYKAPNCLHKFYLESPYKESLQKIGKYLDYKNEVYASKYGWLIVNLGPFDKLGWLVLYNPFLNDIISLPQLPFEYCTAATLTINPNSPDCEVLLVCNSFIDGTDSDTSDNYIARYFVSGDDKKWKIRNIGKISNSSSCNVHYMKGELFCLFEDGALKCYHLKYKSLELVSQRFPIFADGIPQLNRRWWLTEIEENLIAVCMNSTIENSWKIYRFDWLLKDWVYEESLKNVEIFLNGATATVRPLVDEDGKKLEDCRICFANESMPVQCYSLIEKKQISFKQYWAMNTLGKSIAFIEPPYLST